jgi:hypothetical protein
MRHQGTEFFCGAGASPAISQRVGSRKTAGETPAPRKTIIVRE